MAAGLPVVATRAGGVEEAALDGKTAYLANPGDSEGLARAMVKMARDPNMAAMGALGKKTVAGRFRIETTWHEYRDLFISLGAKP
jgi:glycosyltransferase involved in cell wall biosynthesis